LRRIQPQKIEVALPASHAAFASRQNLGAESLQLLEKRALGRSANMPLFQKKPVARKISGRSVSRSGFSTKRRTLKLRSLPRTGSPRSM